MFNWGKVLITGATGFIGRHLSERLKQQQADIVALTRDKSAATIPGIRSVPIDYKNIAQVTQVLATENPGFIFHVAGATKGIRLEDFRTGNLLPTQNLLTATKQAGLTLSRFVHLSSLAAYGPSTLDQPLRESDEKLPLEAYGISKKEAESCVEQSHVPWTILRPAGVYGPGDVDYFNYFKLAQRGLNIFFGNRARAMSVVHISDMVDAILASTQAPTAVRRGYFICDGHPVTFEAFQGAIAKASGRKPMTLDLPEWCVTVAALGGEILTRIDKKPRLFNRQKALMGRQSAWTCTHAAAQKDFGYKPKISLEQGIIRTFAWYRQEGWLK